MRYFCSCLASLMLLVLYTHAQPGGNLRVKTVVAGSDTIQLDTATLLRGSIQMSSDAVTFTEGVHFGVDYVNSRIILLRIPAGTIVRITYRVLLINLRMARYHKSPEMIHPEYSEIRNPFLYTPGNERGEELFRSEGLKMNGSLSRGLSFGNNQDVVLNSNLNMQIAGKINNDVDVLAAISDDNNPIQPEGNTQQLQDFDKVFIQLSKGKTKLVVGDFEMARPEGSYFMNYFKKSRGAQLATSLSTGKKSSLKFDGEGAVSRGRFARNVINGLEGNQGPYRLSGQNGELFIIIISGTEAVYLDGERLTRGEQNDYVIDYNSGEITFMPRRLITTYSRVIVEFQYSDRNFGRSVFHFRTEYNQEGAYQIRANYFVEQDNKTQPLLQNLTDSNKLLLAAVGDKLDNALVPSVTRNPVFVASRIQYRKTDTAGYTDVYVYTDDPSSDTVFYELRFSLVGNGKGNYVQAQTAANGRVFTWVAPVDGVKQGNYEPVTLLISPKRLQMYTIAADVTLPKNTKVSVEVARSSYDKNLYSTIDKENDDGNAARVNISNILPFGTDKVSGWKLRTDANYEFVDEKFRYVERYRTVEFDRTWNRQLSNTTTQDTGFREHILSARATIGKTSLGQLFYQTGFYDRASTLTGVQHLSGASLHVSRNIFSGEAEWVRTSDQSASILFVNEVKRYRAEYGREILQHIAGVKYESEQSAFSKGSDSLLAGSYSFTQASVYVKRADSSRLGYSVEYSQREDRLPRRELFANSTLGRNLVAALGWQQQNNNRLAVHFAYRDLSVIDTTIIKVKPEKTILIRSEYDYSFIRRVFTANTYYQLGSGQELRRDFQYVEVPTGRGTYVWKDFNDDGKQQLNEFVTASFVERNQADYIKVFLPTTSLININSAQFNQTLNVNPASVWSNRRGVLKLISRFSNQTGLKIDRKTTELQTEDFINPFQLNVLDSQLISLSSVVRNTLFFNRSDPTFGCDFSVQDARSKNFLTNGFDSRSRKEQTLSVRWNFTRAWSLATSYGYGNREYLSDFFTANNYNYAFFEIKPRLTYQFNQRFRVTGVFSYFEGLNRVEYGSQLGSNQETGIELRYNATNSGVVSAKYSFYKVAFNGELSSPVGYDMLNGFTVGDNMLWNLNFQQRLGNNLQININYDGRKSDSPDIIHIGRMEARYLF